eukprot:c26046_g1_i1 orf=478-1251(+)
MPSVAENLTANCCDEPPKRKLRLLCFHGFRTSGSILAKQIRKWDNSIVDLLDLTFLDAPFPCIGKSDVEGIFPPPYYEWFRFNVEFTEYYGMEECVEYISNYMDKHGPFDGFLGFSQGAILAAALTGLQQKRLALLHHPPLRFVIIISGALFRNEEMMKDCYSEQIKCPSIHFIGTNDWLKDYNKQVLKMFDNPLVIQHGGKHVVPRLGEDDVVTLRNFLLPLLEEASLILPVTKMALANKANILEALSQNEISVLT